MNAKTFFRMALFLFVAACIFFFFRDHFGAQPEQAVLSPRPTAAPSSSHVTHAESIPDTTRVIAYFFHGHRQCPSCRHLEAISERAIADGFPDAMRSGTIQWRAVDIEDAVNQHFASEYQIYWSSLVLVKVTAGKPVTYKNLEKAWQIQQNDLALRSYVRAEVRAYLGAS